jgi:hypothetical protein
MDAPLTRRDWPLLPPPYAAALEHAVAFACERFDRQGAVHGVVATGTVVRGTPHATSDLDLYVVHGAPFRQRVQRRFAGVPAEIFVNPPGAVRRYFRDEFRDARPVTAHMLATGRVVLARDGARGAVVDALRAEAAAWLARPSYPTEAGLTRARYAAASLYEDATDVLAADPATGALLLARAVSAMLELRCRVALGTVPRGKDLLARVRAADPAIGADAARCFSDAPLAERAAAAQRIADGVLGVRGFFPWDSGPEPVPAAWADPGADPA